MPLQPRRLANWPLEADLDLGTVGTKTVRISESRSGISTLLDAMMLAIATPSGFHVYIDPSAVAQMITISGEEISPLGEANPTVYRYERMIADLQQQLRRYKVLLQKFEAGARSMEEPTSSVSTPLNAASVAVLNSILQNPIPEERILRDYPDNER